MLFVTLARFRRRPTKQDVTEQDKREKEYEKRGLKVLSDYYTLGRYDNAVIIEAPDAKTAMDFFLEQAHILSTETLVAVPRKEARKLL